MESVFEEEVESCFSSLQVPSPKRKRKAKGHTHTHTHTPSKDKSKKPRSAYLLYYFDVHQRLQCDNPELPQSEINKLISENWRRLSVADKAYYIDKANAEQHGLTHTQGGVSGSSDVPGFRRILPRARSGYNFLFLPEGAGPDDQGEEPVEVCVGEGMGPVFSLGSEVDLSEHSVAMEIPREDNATVTTLTHTHALAANTHTHTHTLLTTEGAVGTHTTPISMVMEEGLMQQVKPDSTHLLAILPNQNLLDTKVMTPSKVVAPSKVVTSSSPLLMLPMMPSLEQATKPSLKLSIKYTRRGRGRCHSPGCGFSYVTRHKPPTCPLCGTHLGGKWQPTGSKDSDKAIAKSLPSNSGLSARQPQKEPIAGPEGGEGAGPKVKGKVSGNVAKERAKPGRLPREPVRAAAAMAQETPGGGDRETLNSGHAHTHKQRDTHAHTHTQGQTHTHRDAAAIPSLSSSSSGRKTGRSRGRGKSVCAAQKRTVRAILPAPTKAAPAPATVLQFITVPSPNKLKAEPNNSMKTVTVSGEMSGLKPNTLKQLGHTLPEQKPVSRVPGGGNFLISDNNLKMLSVLPYKQNTGANLDLGLSTARGRGRCKNPECDYVYKNRHKPSHCPHCGTELRNANTHTRNKPSHCPHCGTELRNANTHTRSKASECVLDPYTPLSAPQRETQRQNTLLLLRQCVAIPENEAELHDILTYIQELNNTQVIVSSADEQLSAQLQSGWPRFYESPHTHCNLCQYPLFKGGQSSVAGQEDCWLLTESHLQTASIQIKICTNTQCLALHSLVDIHTGLFNVGNRLLVSLDLFFKLRSRLKSGRNPNAAALDILHNIQNQPVSILSGAELGELLSLLLAGYWAYESLTLRDYNDMICGVCGVAPRVEIAQRNTTNTLTLRNVEFTWPEYSVCDEVQVDDFWLTMENEALEQAAFPSSSPPITRFDASIIAPFIPPLMRSSANGVINTEKDKIYTTHTPAGDVSSLVRCIQEGELKPEQIQEHTHTQLQCVLQRCGVPYTHDSTKEELLESVCSLFAHVQNGQMTGPPPPPHLTAGTLRKLCPHQVVCGSKYLVRAEGARDHVDLLMSSRVWPIVYVTDSSQQVAACTDALYPTLAHSMWNTRQATQVSGSVSGPLLRDHLLTSEPVLLDPFTLAPPLHPLTHSAERWILPPPTHTHDDTHTHTHADTPANTQAHTHTGTHTRADAGTNTDTPHNRHTRTDTHSDTHPDSDTHTPRSSVVCPPELQSYLNAAREEEEEEGPEEETDKQEVTSQQDVGQQEVRFDNAAFYFLYNRLMDFLSSREVVSRQINQVLQTCSLGNVVIRDTLYRLAVAHINTEDTAVAQEVEGDTEVQSG
ncbi:HMG domain-containing protein 3 [Engraulis encrasicolus]|uniref:HMG domain-containing protein 3 n=1 Tax=Engraulis encrasicolus TaxID=184585 RepID=UPI002FD2C6D5